MEHPLIPYLLGAHMIKVGDTLPSATLMEYSEVEGEGLSLIHI